MIQILLAWGLVVYTALSAYSFVYAITIKPDEVQAQGPIQKILYYNALFITGVLVIGAALAFAAIAVVTLAGL